MMCAIMNKFRAISAAARHRLVFDLRMAALLWPGTLTPAVALGEIPAVFNSRLMQPLFTKMANLLQNTGQASEQRQGALARPRISDYTNTEMRVSKFER